MPAPDTKGAQATGLLRHTFHRCARPAWAHWNRHTGAIGQTHTHITLRRWNLSLPSDLGHGPPQPALPEDNASHTRRRTQEPLSAWRGREGTSSQAPGRLAPSGGGSWQHLLPAQGPPVSEHPASSCTPLLSLAIRSQLLGTD